MRDLWSSTLLIESVESETEVICIMTITALHQVARILRAWSHAEESYSTPLTLSTLPEFRCQSAQNSATL